MQFTYRNKTYTLPVQLADITLSQWIVYKQRCQSLRAIEKVFGDGIEPPGLEERVFLSMFANIRLEQVDEFISLADVRTFAGTALFMLEEEEAAIAPVVAVGWNQKNFKVQPPTENPADLTYSRFQQYQLLVQALRNFSQTDDYSALKRIVHSFMQRTGGFHPFDEQADNPEGFFDAIADLPLDLAFGVIRFISDSAVVSGYLSRNPISAGHE